MSICFDEGKALFSLKTQNSLYQMKVADGGFLLHLYYGSRTEEDMSYLIRQVDRGFSGNPYEQGMNRAFSTDTLPQEYSVRGTGDYRIPALCTKCTDGILSADLRYAGHRIFKGRKEIPGLPYAREDGQTETLEIKMRDGTTGLAVLLQYHVFPGTDVITRSAVLINQGKAALTIEKAASLCVDFPYGPYDVIHLHGRHCMERIPERLPLPKGIFSSGSVRGSSSHHHNPFVILCDPKTTEDTGECFGIMLAYSGNHLEEIETDQTGSVRVVSGIQPEGFSWTLGPGERFDTPEAILSFSAEGLNGLSRSLHRMIRKQFINPRYHGKAKPVLINSWEAAYFDFDAEKLLNFAKDARELGAEMLVLDDGWFGRRNDDLSSLGDWNVNEKKLGCSLGDLSDRIHELGMTFGLWFEPEMISEDSDLYRAHPDWALTDPGRKPVLGRNQLVLDMSRPDVVDYLYDSISQVLDSAKIEYVKWDFNRCVANCYSHALPAQRQGEVPHRFILGTYSLLSRLLERYPDLLIEGCSGGGGRFDAGMLFYCPQIWCSDDTDAIERIEIQRGTSYGYPVCTMGAHVSAVPNHQTLRTVPIHTRGIVAQAGTFGYELNPASLTTAEKQEVRKQIEDYHRFEKLIDEGTYYRLTELDGKDNTEAWMFVSEDRTEALVSIVCTHVRANGPCHRIRLKGLDPEKQYRLEGTGLVLTGSALTCGGYVLDPLTGDYPAVQLYFSAF